MPAKIAPENFRVAPQQATYTADVHMVLIVLCRTVKLLKLIDIKEVQILEQQESHLKEEVVGDYIVQAGI